MGRSASRQFHKVMEDCPVCHSRRPKELVERKTREFNGCAYAALGFLTCGLLFLLPFIFYSTKLEIVAYCEDRESTFPVTE